MADKKKEPSATADKSEKAPIKTFVLEDVSASVFAREVPVNGENRTFYSVSFSRSYRDSSGKRQYVKSFNLEDLVKVVTVAQQSEQYVRELLEPEIA